MLKPPVKMEDLMAEWSTDCKLDSTEPGNELIRIPNLHAKYLNVLKTHQVYVRKYTIDYNKMKKVKSEYYHGDLNHPEDLKEYGWEPIHKKILRQDIPTYLDADEELNNILIKKLAHQDIVDYCEMVLKQLNSRSYELGRFIDWQRFVGGR